MTQGEHSKLLRRIEELEQALHPKHVVIPAGEYAKLLQRIEALEYLISRSPLDSAALLEGDKPEPLPEL